MSANVFDALQVANWQRGGGKGDKPTPVRRPGEKSRAEAKKSAIAARAAAFAARQAKG
jgi:hypothetical protein